ncbi:MAG: hypothetical protein E5Y59_03235 [Mesorhizobium sp.]|nr:MAG: hypothetical protein E5Y59_03235 [Mesorhizobium sp.]
MYGDQAQAKTLAAYGRLIDAHMLATGVLAGGLLRIDGAVVEDHKAEAALQVSLSHNQDLRHRRKDFCDHRNYGGC